MSSLQTQRVGERSQRSLIARIGGAHHCLCEPSIRVMANDLEVQVAWSFDFILIIFWVVHVICSEVRVGGLKLKP